MRYKFTSDPRVVFVFDDDGVCRVSMLADRVPVGEPIEPSDPIIPSKDELDAEEAKQYAKLQALRAMSPNEVGVWVDDNVTNLAQAKDAIKTLAIAVCVLSRRI